MRSSGRTQENKTSLVSEAKLEELRRFFRREPRIVVGYLFGSYSRGNEGPLSDVDIALVLERQISLDEEASLISEITVVLGTDEIDVVFLKETFPPRLAFNVISDGQVIYARDDKKRVLFEERVMSEYVLMEGFLEEYDSYFLEKVKKDGSGQKKSN